MKRKNEKDIGFYKSLNYEMSLVKDEDGTYLAGYPDLKGCMTVAPTIMDAVNMAEDAKVAWIETAYENDIPIPKPKNIDSYSGAFKLRVPKSLHKALATAARKEGVSMNQMCVYLLSRELERRSFSTQSKQP